MEKKKILYVSQEIMPYLPDSEMSSISRHLPQGIQEKGREIRAFMPKFGTINERRNQLHEVIRLSGMNLIIDDTDHSLIIKVASIQAARMQVYFIDNDDFFQRKHCLLNEKNIPFEDNDQRAIFFARGVLETVMKLRWAPDIVHCHGWFTGLLPLYLKTAYRDEPLFANTKVIYSMYDDGFKQAMSPNFKDVALIEGVTANDVLNLEESNFWGLTRLITQYSDGIIQGHREVDNQALEIVKASNRPFLGYHSPDTYIEAYDKFYDKILNL